VKHSILSSNIYLVPVYSSNSRTAKILKKYEEPVISKRHHVRNSEFIKAILDVHSFFQEESLKIKNNHPILPLTAIMESVLT
jgi:hypothetical protein